MPKPQHPATTPCPRPTCRSDMAHEPDTLESLVAAGPVICGHCYLPLEVHLLEDGRVGHVKNCWCRRLPSGVTEPRPPEHGPIHHWENIGFAMQRRMLCQCCASVGIPDWGRFMGFFCRRCAQSVAATNRLVGQNRISMGRHSTVNIIHPVRDTDVPDDAAWTAAAILIGRLRDPEAHHILDHFQAPRDFRSPGSAHLSAQVHRLVNRARTLDLLPVGTDDIPMGDYLAAISRLWIDHGQALIDLATTIAEHQSRLEDAS